MVRNIINNNLKLVIELFCESFFAFFWKNFDDFSKVFPELPWVFNKKYYYDKWCSACNMLNFFATISLILMLTMLRKMRKTIFIFYTQFILLSNMICVKYFVDFLARPC